MENTINKSNNLNNLKKNKPYTIVCPPPNVTGNLHIGHCLTYTLIDTITRYKILMGYDVNVLGGTDHAANATTIMVRKNYPDVTPENFHEKAIEWINQAQGNIIQQLKDLGVIINWEQFSYTLDENSSKLVKEAFIILYKKKLIYKAKKIVNWDTHFGTAISDLEVVMKSQESMIYDINYQLSDGNGFITVSSTRPETIFADCAIAINPQDTNHIHLVGKTVRIPIINKEIPIITSNSVDKDFGTGFLKITPGHSIDDYNIWIENEIIKYQEPIDLMDNHGIFSHEILPFQFQGLNVKEARKLVVEMLNLSGKTIKNNIPFSDRSETVVEWKITDQWFFEVPQFKNEAIELLDQELVKFFPEKLINGYKNWINNLQSWCISRDLPLGHRIPIWYDEYGHQYLGEGDNSYDNALDKAKINWNNNNLKPTLLIQDHHRLDTWFSSGLFHRTALKSQFKDQYNGDTDLIVTGYDILFFWITRMILMELGVGSDKIPYPFKNVLFHGLIRDKYGNKMSKTKGNTINPYEISQEYGWDNLRLTLSLNSVGCNDVNIGKESFEETKKILTKLKNADKYCQNYFNTLITEKPKVSNPIANDIIHITHNIINQYSNFMENFECNKGVKLIINEFLYDHFCDYFIEIHKHLHQEIPELTLVLQWSFFKLLLSMNPYCPFITQEIFNKYNPNDNLLNYNFIIQPHKSCYEFYSSMNIISIIRFFQQVFESKEIFVKNNHLNSHYQNMVIKLTKTNLLKSNGIIQYNDQWGYQWFLDGINNNTHILSQEIQKLKKKIDQLDTILNNENFIKNADPDVVINYKNQKNNHQLLMDCLIKLK